MRNVFISYASDDQESAMRISAELKRRGWSVLTGHATNPGKNVYKHFNESLKGAKNILVLLSPAYSNSSWSRFEIDAAIVADHDGKTRVIPIVLADTEFPWYLRGKQYADFRTDYNSGIDRLIRILETTREPPQELRALQSTRRLYLAGVLTAMIASSISSILAFVGSQPFGYYGGLGSYTSAALLAVLTTFIVLVLMVQGFKSKRKAGAISIVQTLVSSMYVDALEKSRINPCPQRRFPSD